MSSCGIQGLNQITEISDWIILETQRLANITPPEKWDVEGGINTPYNIISKIIGATNCKCHEGRQIQSDNPRSRKTSYCFEEEDLAEMRHKLLQIMASTEERFRHNIKERNNSEASGVIKKGDQDHYVFDGGHLPRLSDSADNQNYITFRANKGEKNRYVDFKGPFLNDRGKHVELRSLWELTNNVTDTAYEKVKKGDAYKLRDIYRIGKTIAWKVDGLKILSNTKDAHFTVHKGNRPLLDYYPVERSKKATKYGCAIKIITENAELADAYAMAMHITTEGDLECPLISTHDLVIKPRGQEIMNLKTTFAFQSLTTKETEQIRPIITSSGIIVMKMTRSSKGSMISIRNLSEKHFTVKRLAFISSVINTRRCHAEITFQELVQLGEISAKKEVANKPNITSKAITISTECSGMDTPVTALSYIAENVIHLSSSDNCPAAKKTILANHSPDYFYDDITNRNYEKLKTPDLYVVGFPCQPFSVEGKAKGFDDTNNGHIFQHIVHYITTLLPKSFILENVANIQHHDKGKTLKFIKSEIEKIKNTIYTNKRSIQLTTDYLRTENASTSVEY